MDYSRQVKPISYLKANAAEVLHELAEKREPLVITQNGEAKAVLQDVASYDKTQETLALLKILALGNQELKAGKLKPVAAVVRRENPRTERHGNDPAAEAVKRVDQDRGERIDADVGDRSVVREDQTVREPNTVDAERRHDQRDAERQAGAQH